MYRVKTVIQKTIRVETEEYLTISIDLYKLQKLVMLMAYVMFVNINALMTTSEKKSSL